MKIRVLAVGRVGDPMAEPLRVYEERAGHYWKLEVVEVDGGVKGAKADPQQVCAAEEERLLPHVPPGSDLIALTRTGQEMGSRAFASFLQDHALHARDLCFAIGGAFGLGAGLLARARPLTLSAMTFPHEVARFLLAEQLYRAGTILRGEPYHKGP